MENAEALMGALFNAALVIFIVSAMFAAGLSTTLSALSRALRTFSCLYFGSLCRPVVG